MRLRQLLPLGILAVALASGCGPDKAGTQENQTQDSGSSQDTAQEQEVPQETQTPPETQTPDGSDSQEDGQQGNAGPADMGNQSLIALANECVGKDVSALYEACGEPNDSSYEEDPVSKATVGYLFYDDFTVSTTLDEAGNETVSGVW